MSGCRIRSAYVRLAACNKHRYKSETHCKATSTDTSQKHTVSPGALTSTLTRGDSSIFFFWGRHSRLVHARSDLKGAHAGSTVEFSNLMPGSRSACVEERRELEGERRELKGSGANLKRLCQTARSCTSWIGLDTDTQFTSFTGTKERILTQLRLLRLEGPGPSEDGQVPDVPCRHGLGHAVGELRDDVGGEELPGERHVRRVRELRVMFTRRTRRTDLARRRIRWGWSSRGRRWRRTSTCIRSSLSRSSST
jgi:hypothetical protein